MPCAVAERLRESVAERGEDVLDGVVLVDIEVAAREQLEVEPAWNAQSVSRWSRKPMPGRDARAAGAVEVERDAERGLGARAGDVRGAAGRRCRHGAERREQDVVLA